MKVFLFCFIWLLWAAVAPVVKQAGHLSYGLWFDLLLPLSLSKPLNPKFHLWISASSFIFFYWNTSLFIITNIAHRWDKQYYTGIYDIMYCISEITFEQLEAQGGSQKLKQIALKMLKVQNIRCTCAETDVKQAQNVKMTGVCLRVIFGVSVWVSPCSDLMCTKHRLVMPCAF